MGLTHNQLLQRFEQFGETARSRARNSTAKNFHGKFKKFIETIQATQNLIWENKDPNNKNLKKKIKNNEKKIKLLQPKSFEIWRDLAKGCDEFVSSAEVIRFTSGFLRSANQAPLTGNEKAYLCDILEIFHSARARTSMVTVELDGYRSAHPAPGEKDKDAQNKAHELNKQRTARTAERFEAELRRTDPITAARHATATAINFTLNNMMMDWSAKNAVFLSNKADPNKNSQTETRNKLKKLADDYEGNQRTDRQPWDNEYIRGRGVRAHSPHRSRSASPERASDERIVTGGDANAASSSSAATGKRPSSGLTKRAAPDSPLTGSSREAKRTKAETGASQDAAFDKAPPPYDQAFTEPQPPSVAEAVVDEPPPSYAEAVADELPSGNAAAAAGNQSLIDELARLPSPDTGFPDLKPPRQRVAEQGAGDEASDSPRFRILKYSSQSQSSSLTDARHATPRSQLTSEAGSPGPSPSSLQAGADEMAEPAKARAKAPGIDDEEDAAAADTAIDTASTGDQAVTPAQWDTLANLPVENSPLPSEEGGEESEAATLEKDAMEVLEFVE